MATFLLGINTIPTGGIETLSADSVLGSRFVAAASGSISKGYLHTQRDGTLLRLAVYDASNALIAFSDQQDSLEDGWVQFNFSSGSIVNGQTYLLAAVVGNNGNGSVWVQSNGVDGSEANGSAGAYPAVPDPWVNENTIHTFQLPAYLESAGAKSLPPRRSMNMALLMSL